MDTTDLTLIVFGPLVLGLGLLFMRHDDRKGLYEWAFGVSIAPFLYSLTLLRTFDPAGNTFQLLTPERFRAWIDVENVVKIEYLLGVDGISMLLILLTTIITPLSILTTMRRPKANYRQFLLAILALETCVLGCMCALDLFLFLFFWTVSIVPVFFITGVWGTGRKINSGIKFMIFSLIGCIALSASIFTLQSLSADGTFSIVKLMNDENIQRLGIEGQSWLFWGFMIAFAIRMPIVPLHTWLPDLDHDSPTTGTILINVLMLTLGSYGIVRICIPFFPEAVPAYSPLLMTLGVICIIYGAWIASIQRDLRRLIAYTSISHAGFIVLGLLSLSRNGMTGAVLHIVNLGICIGGLTIIAGFLLERRGSLKIDDFGGLIKVTPQLGTMYRIVTFALIGLPGLSLFTSMFLILTGLFESENYIHGILAATGLIWFAVLMLNAFRRIMLGKITQPAIEKVKDLDTREFWILAVIVLMILYMGLFSPPLTGRIAPGIERTCFRINTYNPFSISEEYYFTERAFNPSDEFRAVMEGIGDGGAGNE